MHNEMKWIRLTPLQADWANWALGAMSNLPEQDQLDLWDRVFDGPLPVCMFTRHLFVNLSIRNCNKVIEDLIYRLRHLNGLEDGLVEEAFHKGIKEKNVNAWIDRRMKSAEKLADKLNDLI